MRFKPARFALLLLLAFVLSAAMLAAFLPEIRRAYWAWSAPTSPNQHAAQVTRIVPRNTPYDQWIAQAKKRIPVFEGLVIQDVRTVALQAWPEIGVGVNGLYLRFADYQLTDGRLLELGVHGRTHPARHLFEADVYFLSGSGHTLFFRDGAEPLRIDWRAGSLVAIPLNVRYQHFNDDDEPARLLSVTSFPFMINSMASESFVTENPYQFTDRFDGRDDYFREARPAGDRRGATNFVPDVGTAKMYPYDERGEGATTTRWTMAGNTQLDLHASEIPPHSHLKAHRHSSDAFILILGGKGYSLIWRGDDVQHRQRFDWRKGTLFVPPTYWYHQHFNTGAEPSRHLALNAPALVQNLGLRFGDELDRDAPPIRDEWQRELAHAHVGAQ